MNKPKSINGLMSHLRDNGIDINGSKEKLTLRNIGYYHGYKGYRFIKKGNNKINYTKFSEIEAIYNYDTNLKSLFYSYIMYIESSYKNIALDIIVNDCKSSNFNTVFDKVLNYYNKYSNNKSSNDYYNAVKDRNRVRDNFYKKCSEEYQKKNNISVHFQNKDLEIPLWGFFEMITLGDFGYFIASCNETIKLKIAKEIGIKSSYYSNSEIVQNIIFTLKNLRNSIAHNNAIFDVRFQTKPINSTLIKMIKNETNINVSFNEIFDYLVLIVFILKNLKITKTKLNKLVKIYVDYTEELRTLIPISIYNQFIATDFRNKTKLLYSYIKN
jgi:abortive infection bacteriophage resistance protein